MPVNNPGNLIPRPQLALNAKGLISETGHSGAFVNSLAGNAQAIRGGMVGLRAGDVVTNLHCVLATAGVGAGYARMAFFALDGTQLGVSGDANAAFTGAVGLLTIPLGTPYTVTADNGFYVCQLSDLASSQPAITRGAGIAGTGTAIGSGKPSQVAQTGQASFPATASFSVGAQGYWFGVS